MSRKYGPKPDDSLITEEGTEMMQLGNSAQRRDPAKTTQAALSGPAEPKEEKTSTAVVRPSSLVINPNVHRLFTPSDAAYSAAVRKLLLHIVRGEPGAAQVMIEANPALLLGTGTVETFAAGVMDRRATVAGTAYGVACGQMDEEMADMVANLLDRHYPGERETQRKMHFPDGEQDNLTVEHAGALQDIFDALERASNSACRCVCKGIRRAAPAGALELLLALTSFRNKTKPQGVISKGFHFSMPLLFKAYSLFLVNFDKFGGYRSYKNKIVWRKVYGDILRSVTGCYGQALAYGIDALMENTEGLTSLPRSYVFTNRRYTLIDLMDLYSSVKDKEKLCSIFATFSSIHDHFYFPLDTEPDYRLGVDFAVSSHGEMRIMKHPSQKDLQIMTDFHKKKMDALRIIMSSSAAAPTPSPAQPTHRS